MVIILGVLLITLSPIIGAIVSLLGIYELVVSFIYKGKVKSEDKNKETYIEIERLEEKLKNLEEKREKLSAGYMSFMDSMNEKLSNIGAFLANSKFELMEYERFGSVMP